MSVLVLREPASHEMIYNWDPYDFSRKYCLKHKYPHPHPSPTCGPQRMSTTLTVKWCNDKRLKRSYPYVLMYFSFCWKLNDYFIIIFVNKVLENLILANKFALSLKFQLMKTGASVSLCSANMSVSASQRICQGESVSLCEYVSLSFSESLSRRVGLPVYLSLSNLVSLSISARLSVLARLLSRNLLQ